MNPIFILVYAFVAIVYGGNLNEKEGWHVPKINGTYEWKSKAVYEKESRGNLFGSTSVQFYLYTMSNPTSGMQIPVNDRRALASSNFNKSDPTRFIIHGWLGTYTSPINSLLRDALLSKGSYNIFSVDWSDAASSEEYIVARYAVSEVGQTVAKYIDFLNQQGMSFGSLTVMGHSLGAHVSGYAGKKVTRGKIATIIGLDPAYPLFSYINCNTRLCSSDASYVESIQTNGGEQGFLEPIGQAAFYPNGGRTQPGCGTDASGSCAHSRCFYYLAEAIKMNNFPSISCSNYRDAVDNDCGTTYSSVRMGSTSNTNITGYYYVPVRNSSPYGVG